MSILSNKKQHLAPISIFIIWLFTLSGIIGMSIGYFDWFIVKTPLNLLLLFTLFVINFGLDSSRKIGLIVLFFISGFMAEWVGVHYGFLFGDYHYGANLGPRLDEIPLLIGANWVFLTLSCAVIAQHFFDSFWPKVFVGAALMVFLDYFIEPSAPIFDFWYWADGHASLHNFIGWFLVAFLLHMIYAWSKVEANFRFSLHVYLSQLVFFVYFYFYF